MTTSAFSILIITTQQNELDMFHQQLSKFGCGVEIVTSEQACCHSLKTKRWDVLVVHADFEHKGGGFELWTRLEVECVEQLKHRPTLFFFAEDGDVENRLAAVRAGGNGFLTMPLDVSVLLNMLDKHIPSLFGESRKKILILEDSDSQRQVLRILFEREGYHVVALEDATTILDTISDFDPDLILSDLYLKDYDGFELAQMLRQWERTFQTPIIILSGESRPDIRRRIVKSGIDDYLLKPMNFEDLLAVVRGALARSQSYKRLIHQDSLTGLINHGHLFEQLSKEIKRAQRDQTSLSLVMIDLDDFKKVNDTYGHLAGDEVLRRLALLFKHRLRSTDTAGRYGGEEIALILPDTPVERAFFIVERLRKAFEAISFRHKDKTFHVTFSFGITCWHEQKQMTTLWSEADESMYEAKRRGKNQGVISADCGKQQR